MRRPLLFLLLFALSCGASGGRTPSTTPNERPNVLIVATDDERFGSSRATPNVYSWFSQGTIFRRAYATTPHCCPSRASIFTGRYVHNHGVTHQSRINVLDHDKTMQHVLQEAGYRTGFVGKFLNGWPETKRPPNFDRWTIGEGYEDARFIADGARTIGDYGPTWVFQQGRSYIDDWEQRDADPWLLMVSTFGPHEPFQPEEAYEEERFDWSGSPATVEADRSDKPPYVRRSSYSEAYGVETRQSQMRVLRSVDDAFMRTIEHLEARGELSNTLVVYLSDNGYLWAEHGMIAKGVPYDGATRVPFYVRGPGIDRATSDRLVANIDVAPTVFDIAGVDPGYEMDGRSVRAQPRDALLLEYVGGRSVPGWSSIVTRNAQYTEYQDGFREFYDLAADPYQLENRPELVPSQLVDALAAARRCAGEDCP